MGMGLVVEQFEVIEGEVIDRPDLRIDLHARERKRGATQLELGLLEMIGIEMEVAKGVHKFAGFVSTDLRDHHGKECVGGDIEGNSEEEIGAALVELAAQAGFLRFRVVNVELEEEVTGGKGHFLDFGDVPRRDEVAA